MAVPKLSITLPGSESDDSDELSEDSFQELIRKLIKGHHEIVELLKYICTSLILFLDLDGTITNTPGQNQGSAFRRVIDVESDGFLYDEQSDIEISSDDPLFRSKDDPDINKADVLKTLIKSLEQRGVLILLVSHNFKNVGRSVFQAFMEDDREYYGWFRMTPGGSELYTKMDFMKAVYYYIEKELDLEPQCVYVDDDIDSISSAKREIPKITSLHATKWLGDNEELRETILTCFE